MNLSPSIDLIWRLAANEMAAGEFKEIDPVHFCMAVLKFAEISTDQFEEAADGRRELHKAVSDDVRLVRGDALERCGIEGTGARRRLRSQLGRGDTACQGGRVHHSRAPSHRCTCGRKRRMDTFG